MPTAEEVKAPTNWSEVVKENTFPLEVNGRDYICTVPSFTQMSARGIIPPALAADLLNKRPHGTKYGPEEIPLLTDEKAQDALLDLALLDPALWDGLPSECPAGYLPRRALGPVRDALVLSFVTHIYGSELVRGAAFRDSAGDGGDGVPNREARRASRNGSDGAADAPVRRGTRPRSSRAAGT